MPTLLREETLQKPSIHLASNYSHVFALEAEGLLLENSSGNVAHCLFRCGLGYLYLQIISNDIKKKKDFKRRIVCFLYLQIVTDDINKKKKKLLKGGLSVLFIYE